MLVGDTSGMRLSPLVLCRASRMGADRQVTVFLFSSGAYVTLPKLSDDCGLGSGGTCARKHNFVPSKTKTNCYYRRVVHRWYINLSIGCHSHDNVEWKYHRTAKNAL